MAHLLGPVGLSETDNAVYLALATTPRGTAQDVADSAELGLPAVRRALKTLTDAGLVTPLLARPMRYVLAPPELSIEALVARRQQELEGLRAAARELALRLHETPAAADSRLVEIIEGRDAIQHRLAQIQLGAREQVMIVDAPPYLLGTPVQNAQELVGLRRGVRYRALYHGPALALPGHYTQMMECIAAGEQARTLASVQMKMQIVDRRVAMMPVSFGAAETRTRLLVRARPLVEALVVCFETLWASAAPVLAGGEAPEAATAGLSERDRQVLSLMAAGLKDQAIARALGVAQRTVVRRIAEMMTDLGADTRFQAGLLAARRGWI
ncbi:LuxR family transcriptional regulator [Actinokineospora sp. NBRC 105648]|uniref:helix-turn-helix transcriptional regulator n=1 Tax=Actinokineospora sp. NBRC 105648 TaxID=3032206 RepID=UPI0024A1AEC4|nr:LuxR family transcriptional regulator [Actinokineospora sp. NBRC 105648]GLZ41864.1 transcriptional regulator [Actinokineospora sp. NBRC 105648]